MTLLAYVVLPPAISQFEHRYLRRLNRVALWFFAAHIPVLMAVAWVADTGPLSALLLGAAVLVGPVLAIRGLKNPRSVSLVHGVTAMLMGGLLVHFGQGPMQIEMHFYFFALLAMLCMFANPMVNLVAAGTAAVHHLGVWLVLPSSVFNYEAQWWVVLVHAGFVVLETIAACYISRSFFDNVIRLEKIVEARTTTIREKQRDMRLILDNVETGLVTVDLQGRLSAECSRVAQEWFGPPVAGAPLSSWLAAHDPNFGDWLDLGLESVGEGMLPPEVALGQLPSQMKKADRTYALAYQLIAPEDSALPAPGDERRSDPRPEAEAVRPEKILVIVSDITERLRAEAQSRRQTELLSFFRHISRDKQGFVEFLDEAAEIVATLRDGSATDLAHLKRMLHTLKGNAAIFGMNELAEVCGELENFMAENKTPPDDSAMGVLFLAWNSVRTDLEALLGESEGSGIDLDAGEHASLLRAVLDGTDRESIAAMLRSLHCEPAAKRLARAAQQLQALAERLGKQHVQVVVQPNGLRMDRNHFHRFWAEFIHVLRNTIDHGVEPVQQRQERGKPLKAMVRVATSIEDQALVVSVEDDGPGIDWGRLKAKGLAQGLAVDTDEAVTELLFASGISARDEVSDVSGRGVGMGAVRAACIALGGTVQVRSQPGLGTSLRFVMPHHGLVHAGFALFGAPPAASPALASTPMPADATALPA
jgi:HPt (histidine-containing phosphotransfer) domain-containing protein